MPDPDHDPLSNEAPARAKPVRHEEEAPPAKAPEGPDDRHARHRREQEDLTMVHIRQAGAARELAMDIARARGWTPPVTHAGASPHQLGVHAPPEVMEAVQARHVQFAEEVRAMVTRHTAENAPPAPTKVEA